MVLFETIALILLSATWGAQIFLRSFFSRMISLSWRLGAAAIFGVASYFAYLQYDLWRGNPLGRFFLGDTGYVFDYIGTRLLLPWVVAFVVALAAGHLVRVLNNRFGKRFMEEEEIPIFALSTFLTGYPGFIFYILAMLFVAVSLATFYAVFEKGRAPLYYLWLPVAISVILCMMWVLPPSLKDPFIL